MSYILDALRKSEQERQRGKVPDFSSAPEQPAQPTPKKNFWPLVAGIAVVVNLALAGYFLLAENNQKPQVVGADQPSTVEPVVSEPPVSEAAVTPQPSVAVRQPQTSTSQPVAPPAAKPAPKPAVKEEPIIIRPKSKPSPAVADTSEPASMPNVGYLPQLEELPAGQRQNIPDMTFSSHMYSSMPKYRSIIINGKRLKEGQFFNSELQVQEITESGVIMNQGGDLFEVDVLGRWAQ